MANKIGDTIKIILLLALIILVYIYRNSISAIVMDKILYRKTNDVLNYNEYYLETDFGYVQNIDKNTVDNYQEVLNMFYSVINSGDESFTFYCNYDGCIKDMRALIKDNKAIADINNFVHPYNSFSTINVDVSNSGRVTTKINKIYNSEHIEYINSYINEFIKHNISDNMSNYNKIKAFHDYIINNTKYDANTSKEKYTAYDLIVTHTAICGGYSDIMSIFLNTIGITNYKIASENHIWNLVNLDGKWYHLDSTWDDPVSENGEQYLIHNFFLISTSDLLSIDNIDHSFNTNVYIEAK